MIIPKIVRKWVYLDKIYHDAWVDVHEEGTEAAAATTGSYFIFACSAPTREDPVFFIANHPFLYMIVHNKSSSILFAGWISNPQELASQSGSAGK